MTDDRRAELLDALTERPDDLDTLRVLADWYTDRDDPRGELIQLELAPKTAETTARIAELVKTHEATWLAPWKAIDPELTFGLVRGHVATIAGDEPNMARHEAALLALRPLVDSIGLINVTTLERWSGSLLLARTSRLMISARNRHVAAWSSLAVLPALRELILDSVALSLADFDAVAHVAPNLESITISLCRLPDDIAAFGRFENLRDVHLPSCHRGPLLGRVLAACRLRNLSVAHNDLTDDGLRALLPALAHAETIDLRDNDLTLGVLDELLAGLHGAVELQLGGNAFGNTGCAKLAAWDRAPALERLHLGDDVTNGGALALAQAPALANLKWLSLAGARLDEPTKAALRTSRYFAKTRIYAGDRMLK